MARGARPRLSAARLCMTDDPLRDDLAGRINLNGTLQALRAKARLTFGNARLQANLQGDLTRKSPPFEGTLRLSRLDLSALKLPQKLAGLIDLSVHARGEGMKLQTLVAPTHLAGEHVRMGTAARFEYSAIKLLSKRPPAGVVKS